MSARECCVARLGTKDVAEVKPGGCRFDADELLPRFVERFWGYGTLEADLWVIGLEEGGGSDWSEIKRRLRAWHERGQLAIEDLVEFHQAFGETKWTGDAPKIQKYWSKVVRMQWGIEGIDEPTTDEVRQYQANRLARRGGTCALLELRPLPSRNVKAWRYGENSDIDWLVTRKTYQQHVTPRRIAKLRSLLRERNPSTVVFFGFTSQPEWEAVAGTKLLRDAANRVSILPQSTVWLSPHPNTHGVTNRDFYDLGRKIREDLNSKKRETR